jgi:hypothetical protein
VLFPSVSVEIDNQKIYQEFFKRPAATGGQCVYRDCAGVGADVYRQPAMVLAILARLGA